MKNFITLLSFFALSFALALPLQAGNPSSDLPQGVCFRLEIGPLDVPLPSSFFRQMEHWEEINPEAPGYQYMAGSFISYQKVIAAQEEAKILGYDQVEVRSFFNGHQVSLEDAITLSGNQNAYERGYINGQPVVSAEVLNELLEDDKPEFFYRIQLGLFPEKLSAEELNLPESMSVSLTKNGFYQYTMGEFPSMEEAQAAAMLWRNRGFESSFIIATFNGNRISAFEAQSVEKLIERSLAAR